MDTAEALTRDLRPALVFLSGELIAVPIPLEREEVILGRALEADVRINDTQASPKPTHPKTTPPTPTDSRTSSTAGFTRKRESETRAQQSSRSHKRAKPA